MGYRHFDRHYNTEKEVRFPFGFGLSYTSFELSDVKIEGQISENPTDAVTVALSVKNIGDKQGAETVQVYLAPPSTGSDRGRPPKSLVTFDKVHLKAGETKTVQLRFGWDAASYWDDRPEE